MGMTGGLISVVFGLFGLMLTGYASISIAAAQESRHVLAPTGKLRVGLYLDSPTHVVRDAASGEMKGVGFDLGKELARRMEVPFEPVFYKVIDDLISGAKSGEWDVAFVGASPARAKEMDFTGPVLESEVGYLVPSGSSISTSADVDRSGIRVGVPEKSQADSVLSRTLKNAELVRGPGLASVLEMVKSGKVEVFAANKANLFEMSDQLPGSKVLDGRFAAQQIAMAIPKGRESGMSYAQKFVEDAKSKGLVKAAIDRAGLRGAVVAPLQ
jgi:polar amino acid transport system substrate-binding protein